MIKKLLFILLNLAYAIEGPETIQVENTEEVLQTYAQKIDELRKNLSESVENIVANALHRIQVKKCEMLGSEPDKTWFPADSADYRELYDDIMMVDQFGRYFQQISDGELFFKKFFSWLKAVVGKNPHWIPPTFQQIQQNPPKVNRLLLTLCQHYSKSINIQNPTMLQWCADPKLAHLLDQNMLNILKNVIDNINPLMHAFDYILQRSIPNEFLRKMVVEEILNPQKSPNTDINRVLPLILTMQNMNVTNNPQQFSNIPNPQFQANGMNPNGIHPINGLNSTLPLLWNRGDLGLNGIHALSSIISGNATANPNLIPLLTSSGLLGNNGNMQLLSLLMSNNNPENNQNQSFLLPMLLAMGINNGNQPQNINAYQQPNNMQNINAYQQQNNSQPTYQSQSVPGPASNLNRNISGCNIRNTGQNPQLNNPNPINNYQNPNLTFQSTQCNQVPSSYPMNNFQSTQYNSMPNPFAMNNNQPSAMPLNTQYNSMPHPFAMNNNQQQSIPQNTAYNPASNLYSMNTNQQPEMSRNTQYNQAPYVDRSRFAYGRGSAFNPITQDNVTSTNSPQGTNMVNPTTTYRYGRSYGRA